MRWGRDGGAGGDHEGVLVLVVLKREKCIIGETYCLPLFKNKIMREFKSFVMKAKMDTRLIQNPT